MTTFADLIGEAHAEIEHDAIVAGMKDDHLRSTAGGSGAAAYADSLAVYLACDSRQNGVLRNESHNMATERQRSPAYRMPRQGLAMVWDFAEANPFANRAGMSRHVAK